MNEKYNLRLYIAGISPDNQTMIVKIKEIFNQLVGENNFKLEVIDVLENPDTANDELILATPTLLRINPSPVKKIVFNFNNLTESMNGFSVLTDKAIRSG